MPHTDRAKQLQAQKNHYQANKSAYKANLYAKRQRNFEYVLSVKLGQKCCRCDESHPACLDFHHIDPATKVDSIANLALHAGLSKIKLEIAKCELLCANCHRKEHAVELEKKYYYSGPKTSP